MDARKCRIILLAILGLALIVRLYHLASPVADSLQVKQNFTANKARCIAGPPFDPLRNSFDFLDEAGHRTALSEEIPLFSTVLAAGYRMFGEQDWIGHALSLIGTLVALLALFDLVHREANDEIALMATALMAASPLLIFYGRAVMPDSWMLAGMLGSAAFYRRYLDEIKSRWLILAAIAGLNAATFKYFGLMVVIPLAEMTWRAFGSWKALFSRRFLGLLAIMISPIMLWMAFVFFKTPNPVESGWVEGHVYPYFVFQSPKILLSKTLYAAFFERFLVKDCGPMLAGLIAIGIAMARKVGRSQASPIHFLRGWSLMGLGFFFLLGPKLRDHDYYELMMLPAAAIWGALGLQALAKRSEAVGFHPQKFAVMVVASAFVVQSPWVMGGLFRLDEGKLLLAKKLRDSCPPEGRIVAIGPGIEFPTIVHYSHREGWPIHRPLLPENWREKMDRYRAEGAKFVAVYFEPKATSEQKASYQPMIESLPILEHYQGSITRLGGPCEFFILSLEEKSMPRNTKIAKQAGNQKR